MLLSRKVGDAAARVGNKLFTKKTKAGSRKLVTGSWQLI